MSEHLSDDQLRTFDSEYVNDVRWALIEPLISSVFPRDMSFHVLDVGGGNGAFADRILSHYPHARVTVAEPSDVLRGLNTPHPRKSVVRLGADGLAASGHTADLVCFNWVLHHLIGPGHRATMRLIEGALRDAASLVGPDGRVLVLENNYEGFPLAWNLPGWLTFRALRTPGLRRLAKTFGANTVGVGVRFQSDRGWRRTIQQAGLAPRHVAMGPATMPRVFARHRVVRALLGLRANATGIYWLARSDSGG